VIRWVTALLMAFPSLAGAQGFLLTDLDAQPGAGREVRISNIRDWRVECEATSQARACSVSTPAQAERASSVLLGTLTTVEDRPVFLFVAPLGLAVQAGAEFRVDGRRVGQFGFRTCRAQGCQIVFRFEGAVANAMRRGLSGELRFSRLDGAVLNYQFSLLGLSAALEGARVQLARP
jgi:invasion protein IalB